MFLEPGPGEIVSRIRAMATDITVRAVLGREDKPERLTPTLAVFSEVESSCTRFVATSPLMRANATPNRWHRVPPLCFAALVEADRAYRLTSGRFDPRVLGDLVRLGYARSLQFTGGDLSMEGQRPQRRRGLGPWRPRFRGASREVLLGIHPVDLGGIGKGLAVRWASQALRRLTGDHLIEAGGDCFCSGHAPDGAPWMVAVEDPRGGATPVAVLALTDRACTTSSLRLRRWRVGGKPVHHLVDPRTGSPGGAGLLAVTVVGADPAVAEVWSKVVFLAGLRGAPGLASRKGLAALWVTNDGGLDMSPAMRQYVQWQASAA
ncbi:MAG: FAD:protein FMN transferase [Candidatus Dormibacteria bacterium]